MTYILKEGLPYLIWKFTQSKQNPFELRECWVNKKTRNYLKEKVSTNTEVFEYGGGGSTLYFSDHAKSVDTLETNKEWISKIQSKLIKHNVTFVKQFPNKKYDLILIDGEGDRVKYFNEAKNHLKPNGIIVFDNIDRYPTNTFPTILFSGYAKWGAGITHTAIYTKEDLK